MGEEKGKGKVADWKSGGFNFFSGSNFGGLRGLCAQRRFPPSSGCAGEGRGPSIPSPDCGEKALLSSLHTNRLRIPLEETCLGRYLALPSYFAQLRPSERERHGPADESHLFTPTRFGLAGRAGVPNRRSA